MIREINGLSYLVLQDMILNLEAITAYRRRGDKVIILIGYKRFVVRDREAEELWAFLQGDNDE
jgi:uncharacterized protein YlzI (FlbEa/FlbD family)